MNILTEDQIALKKLVRDFTVQKLKPQIREFDESGEFPIDIYKESFALGFHVLNIPEEFGGSGLSYTDMVIALEEMAKVDSGFGITMLCTSLALKCVLLAGTKEQIQFFSDILIPGAFGAFCLTEPGSGSDASRLRTTATKDGDDYILNGTKCFVTNGAYADVFIVFATVDRKLGPEGVTAFILTKDLPGITIGKHENKMGLRLSNTCDVALDRVRVPQSNRLGEEGDGFKIAMAGLDIGRVYNAALAVGLAQSAIDESVKYAKERVQFGKPLLQHQAIAFMLADMQIGTEAARQLVWNAMVLADSGVQNISLEASCAKCFAGDNAVKVTTDAVQIFGGYGYSKEYPVEKMMRDAKIFQIFEGTNQIQRMVVAREMAK